MPQNIQRAPGAMHKRVTMQLSDDNYFCRNFGIAMPVPDEVRSRYSVALDADSASVKRIADIMKVNREIRVRDKVTDTTVVPNGSPAVKWDQPGCKPKEDVDAARENIRLNTVLRPNTMIISETVRLVLENNAEIRKSFQLAINGRITPDMLIAYFNIPNIIVAGTVLANNNEGAALTPADIWSDNVVVAHVEAGQDLMLPNLARSFNWTSVGSVEATVETWRDADAKSDIHQADHATDEKIVCAPAGFVLSDTLSV